MSGSGLLYIQASEETPLIHQEEEKSFDICNSVTGSFYVFVVLAMIVPAVVLAYLQPKACPSIIVPLHIWLYIHSGLWVITAFAAIPGVTFFSKSCCGKVSAPQGIKRWRYNIGISITFFTLCCIFVWGIIAGFMANQQNCVAPVLIAYAVLDLLLSISLSVWMMSSMCCIHGGVC